METGQELRTLYKTPDLVACIKRNRLELLRNIIITGQIRVAKNVFESKQEVKGK
jgi:hypothetical protein